MAGTLTKFSRTLSQVSQKQAVLSSFAFAQSRQYKRLAKSKQECFYSRIYFKRPIRKPYLVPFLARELYISSSLYIV
ncbi:hypothetical protein Trydic_g8289 [Trypoxylus dichotomus]